MANQQQNQMQQQPYYYYRKPARSKWWIPLVIIGVIIAFLVFGVLAMFNFVGSMFKKEPVEIKANSVLYLNLARDVAEYSVPSPLDIFSSSIKPSFYNLISAIKKAKNDDRIEGIFYEANGAAMGYAKAQEFLEVLEDFKKSGKFIYAFIEIGGENDYLKALPADKIFMPAEAMMELNGFAISAMFFKGLFDKIGLDFYVEHFEDFKSAGEQYSRKNFSDSARLQLRDLLNSRYSFFVSQVAHYRKLEPGMITASLNRGIYSSDSLVALGFIDSIASLGDVKEMMKNLVSGGNSAVSEKKKLELIGVSDYLEGRSLDKMKTLPDRKKQIAIINAVGPIVVKRQQSLFDDQAVITSKEISKYLKKAREDSNIKAIILRIDSPGGSVIASDAIWDEIVKTKKVKPVYASMSDVAASGGYYIAMACDTIIAHPNTITGSIGVVAMVPNFSGTLGKLNIAVDTLSTGPAAQDLNLSLPFSMKQRSKFRSLMGNVYNRFVTKAAESRKKSFNELRSVAKGRIWSGAEALRLGLVDTIGGIRTSINIAKRRMGIPEGDEVQIVSYPKPMDNIDAIIKIFTKDDDDNASLPDYFSRLGAVEKPEFIAAFYNTLPMDLKRQFRMLLSMMLISQDEPVMMMAPELPLMR